MTVCRVMLIVAVSIIICCFALLATMVPWAIMALLVLLGVAAAKRGYTHLTTLGSARWAEADDLRKAGMLDAKSGLILGRITDSRPKLLAATKALFNRRVDSAVACEQFLDVFRKPPERLVKLPNAVHTAVFAPAGAGKSTGLVIPYLLTSPDSCVVVDFKGELASITAEHRRDVFGHRVVLLDPFKVVTQTPDRFNPLDHIDKANPLALDDCRSLAEALVVRTGQEKEPHWADSAEVWIGAMLAVVAQYGEPGDRSLQTVRTLLSNPAKMEAVIKLMCGATDVWDGMLARMGHQLTHYKDKELGSTLTTTNRFLRFLDTLAVLDSTKGSSFNPAELCNGKMTIYCILPPEFIRSQGPLLRMWIGSFLREVVRGGLQEKNKVHFVCDEASSLGHMAQISDALTMGRGYGLRMQLYYQDCGQLKKSWPEGADQTLLANASQVFFGVNDQQTAEYVSARLGEETIVVDSGGTSNGRSVQTSSGGGGGSISSSWNQNANWGQQARKLLKPEEVAALPSSVAIIFTPGIPPLWTNLVRYYEEPDLGREPGSLKRFRSRCKTLAGCVSILALAIVLAVWVTGVVREQRNRMVQYGVPNGSAHR